MTASTIRPQTAHHAIGALPAIAAERCVHNKAVVASCRACADACPRGAWAVDEDGVSLDAQFCDGCGLCAPACPQSVIFQGHRVARRRLAGQTAGQTAGQSASQPPGQTPNQTVAFAACSQTGLRNSQDGGKGRAEDAVDGVLPCLNVLSLSDLAALHADGVRRMVITRGTCATCPTGSSTAVRLERAVEELNLLLEGRGLPPLLLARRSVIPWRAHLAFDTTPDATPNAEAAGRMGAAPNGADRTEASRDTAGISRRGLFRLSSRRGSPQARAASPGPAVQGPASQGPRPPGRMLPQPAAERLADSQPWPWVPSIDAAVCEGCASCARLCPTGAIRLADDPPAFLITAEDCTGCRLCVDVCRPGALILERLAPRRQSVVPLRAQRCPSCGVTARLPAASPGADDGLCPICRRTPHKRRLFQVL